MRILLFLMPVNRPSVMMIPAAVLFLLAALAGCARPVNAPDPQPTGKGRQDIGTMKFCIDNPRAFGCAKACKMLGVCKDG